MFELLGIGLIAIAKLRREKIAYPKKKKKDKISVVIMWEEVVQLVGRLQVATTQDASYSVIYFFISFLFCSSFPSIDHLILFTQ
jgi:hypothetical protein